VQIDEINEARINIRLLLTQLDGDIQYIDPFQTHDHASWLT
jgi:hypothetical protein